MRKTEVKHLLVMTAGTFMAIMLMTGCSTTKVGLDRAGIAEAKRIGEFTWRGRPFYSENVGTGIIGAGASIGNTLFSAASGKIGNTVQSIYNSGVYEAFEEKLISDMSAKVPAKVTKLSRENYVYEGTGNKRKVDVLASAKAQGYDAVIETTVWPALYENQPDVSQAVQSEASLKTDIVVKRCADGKVLWKVSYTSKASGNDFKALAGVAADRAVKLYTEGK